MISWLIGILLVDLLPLPPGEKNRRCSDLSQRHCNYINFPQVGTSPSIGGIVGGGLLLLKVITSVGLFQISCQNPQDNFNAMILSNEVMNGGRIGGILIHRNLSNG